MNTALWCNVTYLVLSREPPVSVMADISAGKRIFAYLDAFKPIPMVLKALAATGQPVLVFMSSFGTERATHGTAGSNLIRSWIAPTFTEATAQCVLV